MGQNKVLPYDQKKVQDLADEIAALRIRNETIGSTFIVREVFDDARGKMS
jgi:hypothetical protein